MIHMRFRTLALALALCCGLSVAGQAAGRKTVVVRRHTAKGRKFKAAKMKNKHAARRAGKQTRRRAKG
jgi:hypothetical protein